MSITADLPDRMKAAVLRKPFEIVLEDRPVPEVGPDEVLIKVMAVGVCGSDVHYYETGRIGRYVVEKPIILGHECAGIVAAVGDNVTRFKVGDRVAVEPGVTCGTCEYCKQGRYNLCPDVKFLATPPYDGAFVQYFKHRQDFVFHIPDHLTFEEAAMIEPFSVGIHAATRAGIRPGSTVAIFGLGPVGLMAVVAAKAFGASRIIAVDLEEIRLKAAKEVGATLAINAKEADALKEILDFTDKRGVDVAIEAAGHPKTLQDALASLCRGGKLAVVGLPAQDNIPLNVPEIADKEVDIYGIFRYANTYPKGIDILSSGIADVRSLVTGRFSLAQTAQALEEARINKAKHIKIMVYPNEM
ncbi:L-iditol 2-dehydrogenase [Caldicoprobacter guelmensis]|uniref:NAD(P)-dependent alcohol dehydrogenase n=1 Tax=Caldicoprobacter guelmensis TaxID=1170224 RepID=UPI001A9C949E|nr:NAD(P)-dependent alcohol dehydrogenase [Caldicoprobacter guelmensis]MBM7581669.1 L-iditol 2-dehydrogenase [Caldicoprobacter guelmensis]